MNASFRLGKPFGIPLLLHYTWFIIFALVTFSLAWHYYPTFYPLWRPWLYWTLGVATSLLFFTSVLIHELSHSLVSNFYGIPVRSITLFIFGGVARISREARRPKEELFMAVSGPVSSLLLGGFFGLIWWLMGPANPPLGALAWWLLRINVLLALFNLIPGFPLDGGRVFRSLVWQLTGNYRLATQWATFLGQGIAFLFIFGGFTFALFTGDWFSGIWLAFIGWFLSNAVSITRRQAFFRDKLWGVRAEEVMLRELPLVSSGLTLKELVEGYALPKGQNYFMVEEGGRLVGMVTIKDIKAIPKWQWPFTAVVKAMLPSYKLKIAPPEEELVNLWERMEEERINHMPIVKEGRVVGIITKENILRFIQTRMDLGV